MSFSIEEIELLYHCLERVTGLGPFELKVYEAAPMTIKITHKATNNFFVLQRMHKFVMLVKPEHKNYTYNVDTFDEVLATLIQWQLDLT